MARTRSNASELALNRILQKINSYELASGDVVSDLELSREFDMSRTPIREAISKLLDVGVLERTTTKVIVKPITFEDIKEIFAVKEAIELMSVRLILEQGGLSDQDSDQLLFFHEKFKDYLAQGKFEDNFIMDSDFHAMIISFSQNTRLLEISKQTDIQMQRLRWINMLTPSQFAITVEEHANIISALMRNDLRETEQMITLHCKNAMNNYNQIISNPHWGKLMKELSSMN